MVYIAKFKLLYGLYSLKREVIDIPVYLRLGRSACKAWEIDISGCTVACRHTVRWGVGLPAALSYQSLDLH